MIILGLFDEDEDKELEDIALSIRYGNNEAESTQEYIPELEFCF